MMKRLSILALMALMAFGFSAQGQVLRWSAQGDPQTMDPHSQNESLTNSINGQVYEKLTRRDKQLGLVPGLAVEWMQVSPLVWRFKLRPGVKFHDGAPFTADDVVFSINRAKAPTSQLLPYANAVGTPRKVDELTVEFTMAAFDPIFLQHLDTLQIMSKTWCEAHGVTRPLDYTNKEESYTSLHANGTGAYMLVSRQPDVKTVYKRNLNWWNKFEGNVQNIVFTPIGNDATRLAALVSGEIDFVLDPSPRDVPRLRSTPGVKIIDGPENRLVFLAMDQSRDKLLYGKVPGDRNPFKDLRVRRALYQAIDVEAMRTKVMNGLSRPTGALTPTSSGSYDDPALEARLPYDIAAARKLMAEAGYADGFEVTLDCPNNRYINDESICKALAAMWAQLKIKVRVSALPRSLYFPKVESMDTSLYMYGWGGNITDAEVIMTPVFRNRGKGGVGYYNFGNVHDDAFDALAAQSSVEQDPVKRAQLVKAALTEYKEQVHVIPLHRQMIPWGVREGVSVVHRADNWLEVSWVKIGGNAGK